jgi:hypothetical protein
LHSSGAEQKSYGASYFIARRKMQQRKVTMGQICFWQWVFLALIGINKAIFL